MTHFDAHLSLTIGDANQLENSFGSPVGVNTQGKSDAMPSPCGCENDSLFTPLTASPAVDYTAAPSTVDNHYNLPPEQFHRLRDVANRRAARVVNSALIPLHPRCCKIEHLLAYNELFAEAVVARDPSYYDRMAEQQRPEYLYIGCSDSRVVASEIMGLCPGEVFVHRNVANIVSPSDLNMLSALQYSVDHLKVRHVIVAGHYKCGGVMAALHSIQLGLADHWVSHVVDVKKIHWSRLDREVPLERRLDALCELNVLAQVSHLVDTHIVQRIWERQNREEDARAAEEALRKAKAGETADSEPADSTEVSELPTAAATVVDREPSSDQEVVIHGWIYGLGDGLIKPLVTLTRRCSVDGKMEEAEEAVFARYRADPGERVKPLSSSS